MVVNLPETNVNYIKYLIGLSQKGRKNSFMELCELGVKEIYTLSAQCLADKEIAKEVTKDVFISAWKNIRFVRDDISITAWLIGIAVYEILEELRSRQRRKRVYPDLKKNDLSVQNKITTKSDFERIILDLPELERVIFVLHDIESYSCEEISDFFDDLSIEEVQRVLKIARTTLLELFEE